MKNISVLLLFVIAVNAAIVEADEWFPPHPETYYSIDSTYRFLVIPRMTEQDMKFHRQRGFWDDGVKEKRLDFKLIKSDSCIGTLSVREKDTTYKIIWSHHLFNITSPVGVYIFNNGKYLITFDEWYRVGFGETVIVIYTNEGALYRHYSLESFLPEEIQNTMHRSISSRWWKEDFKIDEANMILQFSSKLIKKSFWGSKENIDTFRLNLETGKLIERGQRIEKK